MEALVGPPKTVSELSRQLGLPKSSLHGIATTLIHCEWVVVDASGRLALGERLFEIGVLYGKQYRLIRAFREAAQRAVEATGETTFLGALAGKEVEHLARVDGTRALRLVVREGDRLPAHATALGKAILAGQAAASLGAILGRSALPRLTSRTVVRLGELRAQFTAIRRRGYAVELGEVDENLHCVAAPVRDATGTTIASVAIAAPAFRAGERLSDCVRAVVRMGHEISRRLGYESSYPDVDAKSHGEPARLPEDARAARRRGGQSRGETI